MQSHITGISGRSIAWPERRINCLLNHRSGKMQPIQKQTEQIENDPQHQKSCSDREEGHIWKTDR